jgi:hypothetical protein
MPVVKRLSLIITEHSVTRRTRLLQTLLKSLPVFDLSVSLAALFTALIHLNKKFRVRKVLFRIACPKNLLNGAVE